MKQSRKLNQEVFNCTEPNTSIFLDGVSPNTPQTSNWKQIFLTLELFYWFQAGRLTYFSVLPYELYIRINEFILSNTTLPKRSILISFQIVLHPPFCSTQKFIGPNFNLRQLMNPSLIWTLHAGTRFIIPSFFHVSRETVTIFIFIWSCISLFLNSQLIFSIF